MHIRFTPTAKDRATLNRALTGRPLRLWQRASGGVAGLLYAYVIIRVEPLGTVALLETFGVFIAIMLFNLAYRRWYAKTFTIDEPDAVNVETTLFLAPDGLTQASPRKRVTYAWNGITSVEKTPEFLLLKITPARAFYVPVRFFYDEQQLNEFAAQAESYRQATVTAAPPSLDADLRAGAGTPFGDSDAPVNEDLSPVWPPRPQIR